MKLISGHILQQKYFEIFKIWAVSSFRWRILTYFHQGNRELTVERCSVPHCCLLQTFADETTIDGNLFFSHWGKELLLSLKVPKVSWCFINSSFFKFVRVDTKILLSLRNCKFLQIKTSQSSKTIFIVEGL